MDPKKQPFSSSNEFSDSAASSSSKLPITSTTNDYDVAEDEGLSGAHSSESDASGGDSVVIDSAKLHGNDEASKTPDMEQPVDASMPPAPFDQTPEINPESGIEARTAMPSEVGLPPSPVPTGMVMPDNSAMAPSPPLGDSDYVTATSPVVDIPRKSKKKLLFVLILATTIVILLGATAAAYYVAMNKPQNVLDMALANTFSPSKVTSVSFEGNVSVASGKSSPIAVAFTGASDQNGAFTLSGKVDALLTTIMLDARSADGSTVYARVGGLNGIPQLLKASGSSAVAAFAPIIAGIDNQWIQINQSMVKQLTGSDASLNAKLSTTDRQKLETAYKQNKFLVAQKSLAAESIKGHNSFHFQVTVDKVKLKSFITAVKSENIQNVTITQDNLNSLNNQLDKVDFNKYPMEIWVTKSNKLIDQIVFTTTQGDTKLTARLTADDYNKPINVVIPSGSKTLLNIISNLLTGSSAAALNSLSGVSL